MAFNTDFFITGLSELAPSTIAVFKAFARPQKDKYGFLVYVSFRRLLWIILEFLFIEKKNGNWKTKTKKWINLTYLDIFLKRRLYKVILTTS